MNIKNKIRDFFIPSLQNQLSPYSLRYGTLIFIALLSIGIELAFYAYVNVAFKQNLLLGNIINSIQTTVADVLPDVIIEETNNSRLANNEKPLETSRQLALAAKLKVEDMVKNNYFSHQGPDGSMAWNWMDKVNYSYAYAGENLAVNFFDAKDVVKAWMTSPTHRENILNNHYTEIGVAAARGIYQGKETVFVVQMFGSTVSPDVPVKNYAQQTTPSETKKAAPVVSLNKNQKKIASTTTASTSDISIVAGMSTTSSSTKQIATSGISTTSGVGSVSPRKNISVVEKWLVSPRHLARDAYFVLLIYMSVVLLVPMGMIYYRHVSASRWLRFKEIFILFKRPIMSALVTLIFITLAMYLNYAWGRAGSNIYNMSIERGVSKQI